MKCLNCKEEMINYDVQTKKDHISYNVCEACGSFWLDAGELKKMAYQVEGDIEVSSEDKIEDISGPKKKCPRCPDTTLDKVFFLGYSDIILDRCGNCEGFWLDGGELDLINKELQEIMPIKGHGFSDFVNNVHLPYWYKKIRKKSSETDFMIDVPPIKDAKFKSETSYVCPACSAKLNQYEVYGIGIEGCPKCKGLWMDKDELRKLKDRSDQGSWRTLEWMDDEVDAIEKSQAVASKQMCPKCQQTRLISTSFGDSKTIIDWCPSCQGTWLDRDEFQDIVDFLKSKLNAMSSEDMTKEVYKEIKEIWKGPDGLISEMLDAKAAISTLINIKIFEHPKLYETLNAFRRATNL